MSPKKSLAIAIALVLALTLAILFEFARSDLPGSKTLESEIGLRWPTAPGVHTGPQAWYRARVPIRLGGWEFRARPLMHAMISRRSLMNSMRSPRIAF